VVRQLTHGKNSAVNAVNIHSLHVKLAVSAQSESDRRLHSQMFYITQTRTLQDFVSTQNNTEIF
jgi:hypothetical protein